MSDDDLGYRDLTPEEKSKAFPTRFHIDFKLLDDYREILRARGHSEETITAIIEYARERARQSAEGKP